MLSHDLLLSERNSLLVAAGEDGLGAMQLARTPLGPASAATCWVSIAIAALAAQ
jgi:hypothetical protein